VGGDHGGRTARRGDVPNVAR